MDYKPYVCDGNGITGQTGNIRECDDNEELQDEEDKRVEDYFDWCTFAAAVAIVGAVVGIVMWCRI